MELLLYPFLILALLTILGIAACIGVCKSYDKKVGKKRAQELERMIERHSKK